MKTVIVIALGLSLLSVAAAQMTQTYYSDASCATPAAGTLNPNGFVNPLIAPLNTCVKQSAATWVKFSVCSGTTATGVIYGESGCLNRLTDFPYPAGACAQMPGVYTGVSSMRVVCSSASSATLAIVSVVAAAFIYCL